jgi:hypothetical protein
MDKAQWSFESQEPELKVDEDKRVYDKTRGFFCGLLQKNRARQV